MAKLVLVDTVSGYQQASTINLNNAATIAAVESSLSRDATPVGTSNAMNVDLDMNSHKIMNLAAPSNPNDAARLTDLQNVSAIIGTTVPPQGGNAGKSLGTDGTNLVFTQILPLQAGQANKQLQTDGTNVSWQPSVAGQAGQSGKFLTTDGTNSSWALPLPAQASNSGKILTTDGTNASWTSNLTLVQVAGIRTSASTVSGTTLTGDALLNVTIPSAGWYRLEACFLVSTANNGNGFKYQWNGTATQTTGSWTTQGTNNSAGTFNNYTTPGAIATHNSISLTMDTQILTGFMQFGAGGSFFLTWAMNAVVSGVTTMNPGSWLVLSKLA